MFPGRDHWSWDFFRRSFCHGDFDSMAAGSRRHQSGSVCAEIGRVPPLVTQNLTRIPRWWSVDSGRNHVIKDELNGCMEEWKRITANGSSDSAFRIILAVPRPQRMFEQISTAVSEWCRHYVIPALLAS